MIRQILKLFVPKIWLKRAFLFYNKLKIRFVDPMFFRILKLRTEDFVVKEEKNPFLELAIPMDRFDDDARRKLKIWTDPQWTQDQYLYIAQQPGWIDPASGWAMTQVDNRLIFPSLGFSHAPHVKKPDLFEYFNPVRRKIKNIEYVLSLRDTGEENYFHFFNDVLSKILFAKDRGIDLKEVVIVISDRLYQKEYFKVAKQNSWLKSLTWFVQIDEWVLYQKAIFCKPYTHTIKYLEDGFRMLAQAPVPTEERRIFLTRSVASLRFIENMNELMPLLIANRFEIVDSAKLSVSDQVQLFTNCRYLIGIHGAGLVNMAFRNDRPLSILEIVQPFDYIPFHYIMLAYQFKFQYQVLMGTKGVLSSQGGFRIDISKFEQSLKKLF